MSAEFAADRPPHIVSIQRLRYCRQQSRVDEYKHIPIADLPPKWIERGIIDEYTVDFRGDDGPLESKVGGATAQFAQGRLAIQRIDMGRTDELAGIISFGFPGTVVDPAREIQVCAHSGRTGQECGVDPGAVHHRDVLVEIGEQSVRGHAGRPAGVDPKTYLADCGIVDEFARHKMVLEVHKHLYSFFDPRPATGGRAKAAGGRL